MKEIIPPKPILRSIRILGLCLLLPVFLIVVNFGEVKADTSPTVELHKKISQLTDEKGQSIDNQYELSLDIKAGYGSETISQPLDVIFIADISNSMENEKVNDSNGNKVTRLKALKNALNGTSQSSGLVDNVLSNPNNRLSIVTFGGSNSPDYYSGSPLPNAVSYDDAWLNTDWTTNTQVAKKAVTNINVKSKYGNTNISAGLNQAGSVVANSRVNAKKVVILLTDGEANAYYDRQGYTELNWNDYGDFLTSNKNAMKRELQSFSNSIDGFYSVNFSGSVDSKNLTDLHSYLPPGVSNQIFRASSESELAEKLKEITDSIIPTGIKKVTISDVLSKYVELLDVGARDIRVVKENPGGGETVLTDNEVTLITTTNSNGLVEVTAEFSDDYILENNVRYALKFKVQATQTALDEIADTNATQFLSNDAAQVTYTYGTVTPTTQTVQYPENPVFTPSKIDNLPISVKWEATDTSLIPSNVKTQLHQDGNATDYRTAVIAGKGSGTWTSSYTSVAKGHTYSVTSDDVAGFTKEIKNVGTTTNPSFEVTYKQLPTLRVKKNLIGDTDTNKTFTIVITASVGGNNIEGSYNDIKFHNGKATITIKSGEVVAIPHLPIGTDYTVTEEADSTKGYQVTYENATGTLTTDTVATVTNHKLPSLTLTKKVKGIFGDFSKAFTMSVRVKTADGAKLNGNYKTMIGGVEQNLKFTDGEAEVQLKHNQNIVITDLPLGATYTIVEKASSAKGYHVTYENETGTLDQDKSVTIINTMEDVPSTATTIASSTAVRWGTAVIGGLLVACGFGLKKIKRG